MRFFNGMSWWHVTLVGRLLSGLLLIIACTQAAQPVPATAAASPAGNAPKAYVGLFKDNAVAVLDTRANRVLTTISVPPGPHGLVVTPDGRKVYVSSDGGSTVSVIDTASDRVVGSIEVGQTPHGLAISPDGSRVLASVFGANQAVVIDTRRDRIIGRVSVPEPHNSAISPNGRTAYVGSQLQGATALVILDLTTGTRTGALPLDRSPRAMNFSPDGNRLYFTVAGADTVEVLDPQSNRIVAEIPVGASPHHPLFTPDGQSGLVVSQGPGELEILDPARNAVSAVVKVGLAPHWIAVTSDGRTAYVTNESSNDVSVVDLASRAVMATIPVGNAPRKIAVQPAPVIAEPIPAPVGGQVRVAAGPAFSDHGTTDAKDRARLAVETEDYYFEPTFLRGRPGQQLVLEIENRSGTLHNISIPGQKIDTDIPPKGKILVHVTFPQSGVMRFFCKFHTALGMNGGLLVGDAIPGALSMPSTGAVARGAGY